MSRRVYSVGLEGVVVGQAVQVHRDEDSVYSIEITAPIRRPGHFSLRVMDLDEQEARDLAACLLSCVDEDDDAWSKRSAEKRGSG